MDSKYLLPYKYKIIGWLIFIPFFILGILWMFNIKLEIKAPIFVIFGGKESFSIITKDIYNEIIAIPLLICLMMITFAREKDEDEYISKLRLESLIWAVYINFILLLLAIIFFIELAFYKIMVVNMFTVLILFIIRFNLLLLINRRRMKFEE